jgi:hypothetical protein
MAMLAPCTVTTTMTDAAVTTRGKHAPRKSATLELLVSNALTLVFALWQDWPLAMLLWPYWLQSVIIGWYAARRMLALQDFSTEGFTSNDKPVPETAVGRRSTVLFFACHYGFFHLVYFLFLTGMAPLADFIDFLLIVACTLAFAYAQRSTFRQQVAADAQGRPNLGALMFLPYVRIVPMHLTIIFSAAATSTLSLLVFIPLKTLADIGLDTLDRKIAEKTLVSKLFR